MRWLVALEQLLSQGQQQVSVLLLVSEEVCRCVCVLLSFSLSQLQLTNRASTWRSAASRSKPVSRKVSLCRSCRESAEVPNDVMPACSQDGVGGAMEAMTRHQACTPSPRIDTSAECEAPADFSPAFSQVFPFIHYYSTMSCTRAFH